MARGNIFITTISIVIAVTVITAAALLTFNSFSGVRENNNAVPEPAINITINDSVIPVMFNETGQNKNQTLNETVNQTESPPPAYGVVCGLLVCDSWSGCSNISRMRTCFYQNCENTAFVEIINDTSCIPPPPPQAEKLFVEISGNQFYFNETSFTPIGTNYVDVNTYRKDVPVNPDVDQFLARKSAGRYYAMSLFDETRTSYHMQLIKDSGSNTARIMLTLNPMISQGFRDDAAGIDSISLSDKSQWSQLFNMQAVAKVDSIVAAAKRNNVKLIITQINYEEGMPKWWFSNSFTDPRTLKAQEIILRFMADRYKDEETILSWSIINEPRVPFDDVDPAFVAEWNDWIRNKYGNEQALRNSWNDFGRNTINIRGSDLDVDVVVGTGKIYYNGFVDFSSDVQKINVNGQEKQFSFGGRETRIWTKSALFIANHDALILDSVSDGDNISIVLYFNETWQKILPPDNALSGSQRLKDYQDFREYIAAKWLSRMTAAIRQEDPNHLITLGMHQYSTETYPVTIPSQYSAFNHDSISPYVDYLSIHIYQLPELGSFSQFMQFLKTYIAEASASGKPVVIEEFGELFDSANAAQFNSDFISQTSGTAHGWIVWQLFGFYYDYQGVTISSETGLYDSNNTQTEWGRRFAGISAVYAE